MVFQVLADILATQALADLVAYLVLVVLAVSADLAAYLDLADILDIAVFLDSQELVAPAE